MSTDSDNNNQNPWKVAGIKNKLKNQHKRKTRKLKIIQQKKKDEIYKKKYEEQQKKESFERQQWKKRRQKILQEKKFEDIKKRQITKEFAQAIQNERAKKNITRLQLAKLLNIKENDLASYENAESCPPSRIIIELRKLFPYLPRQYFTLS